MRRVFADTSALLALVVPQDRSHSEARRTLDRLREREVELVTTSYVLVETHALLGRRIGLAAVRAFREKVEPNLSVVWVDEELHEQGLDLLLSRGKRDLSLVDAVSFVACRAEWIEETFAFDRHFTDEGFSPVR